MLGHSMTFLEAVSKRTRGRLNIPPTSLQTSYPLVWRLGPLLTAEVSREPHPPELPMR